MTTSSASNSDLKSSMGGELGMFGIQVPSSVLAASIVVVGSVLGNPLVGVQL
jgi:hypothetical protein